MTDPTPESGPFTIDELARHSGMTVRNIRAHQSRGLLPPPQVRGRTGYYGSEHVARIGLIKELQADGFNLEAIRRLLESAGGSTDQVLRFTRAVAESFPTEQARTTDLEHLRNQWGPDAQPQLLRRAVELGLLRPLGDETFEERSPRLSAAARELRSLGIGPERTMDIAEQMRRHADGIAGAFVQLFLDEVWQPFVEAGQPEERWPEVFDALERLTPLAAESLHAIFQMAMTERVEQELGEQIKRVADGDDGLDAGGRAA